MFRLTKEHTLDFVNLQFPEVFLRFFASDGCLPYFLKCFSISIVVWAPGLLATHASGTLSMYITDVAHYTWDIGVGISLFLIVYLCRRIDQTFQEVDNLVQHSTDENFPKFVRDWNNSSSYWYYFCAFGPLLYYVITDLLHIFAPNLLHGPFPPWADESIVSWETVWLNTPYLLFEHVIVGPVIGIGFNRFLHYLLFVRDYGRRFLCKKT